MKHANKQKCMAHAQEGKQSIETVLDKALKLDLLDK